MEDHLAGLHQSLFGEGEPDDRLRDLLLIRHRPRTTSTTLALRALLSILKRAVSPIDEDRPEPVRFSFQLWSETQVESVVSLGLALVSASRSLPPEQVEPVFVAVVQQLLEFAVCYLESSDFGNEDLSMQSHVVLLMELAMFSEVDKPSCSKESCSLISLQDLGQMVYDKCHAEEEDDYVNCGLSGFNCLGGGRPVDRLLMSFASECIQPERQNPSSCRTSEDLDSFILLSRHWAVVHVECIRRLLSCCKKLIQLPEMSDEKMTGPDSCKRLSFSLRILQLLRKFAEELPCFDHDYASLLQEVASCADVFPALFRHGVEFADNHVSSDGSLESLMLLILEEFLHLVQIIFCNSCAFVNIQACIAASMLDNLNSSLRRYNKTIIDPKPPLMYFPQAVLYTLKLIKDIKRLTNQALDLKPITKDDIGSLCESPSCHAHCKKVPLLETFTVEEILKTIFAPSTQWMDNLIHLTLFLHSEGMKMRPRLERPQLSRLKASLPTEPENAVAIEDEALFGNLFSEGGRSVGSVDGYDQPTPAVDSCVSNCNMPIQAASELMSFLKDCVFSGDWSSSLFEDACKSLSENHIDVLLSILNSQPCYVEERSSDSGDASLDDRKILTAQEVCFALLQNLLTSHSLSGSLEEHLVDQILKVENDKFMYNNQTLSLLAYTIVFRAGESASQLRTKIYRGFVDFIVAKTKAVCLKCPGIRELVGCLPSVFHIEILVMVFHLSSEEEKAAFAEFTLSSLQAVDSPAAGSPVSHLTCWALLISRLILLLRHMVSYPQSCPSSLLLNLKSMWRDATNLRRPDVVSDQLSSFTSAVMKNILGSLVEEGSSLSCLIGQLIEVPAIPPLLCRDNLAIEHLHLSWNDLSATFSKILGLWKGRKGSAVEDLFVERYVFSLCSDIPSLGSASGLQLSIQNEPKHLNLSDTVSFFEFSCSIMGQCDCFEGKTFLDAVVCVLQFLCASTFPDSIDELGWDFLRNGLWLSFVLSLLNVGISGYCIKNKVSEMSPFWVEKTAKDNHFALFAESLVSSLLEAGQVSLLLSLLSLLLNSYLGIYQKAFIVTMNSAGSNSCVFSSLLLKHSSFDGCQLDELLKESGASSQHLESVLYLLPKLVVAVGRGAPGVRCQVFLESLLHGFPSHLQTSSAIFVSCTLAIRGIISILGKFCGSENCIEGISLEKNVLHQIIESVMTVKFDRIFQSFHGTCDAIIGKLLATSELSDCANLFLMRQMEDFLRDINANQLGDTCILEWVITKIIDTVQTLRRSPINFAFFKLLAGGDGLESAGDFLWLEQVDLVLLVNSLDNCLSDSINIKVLNFLVDLLTEGLSPVLRLKIEKKFLDMDLLHLSKWLESRLLGCIVETSGGVNCGRGSSLVLREATMNFFLSLTSFPAELCGGELHTHLFEALLMLVDDAFLLFDVHIATSYFNFVVQLARGEYLMQLLLNKTVKLMAKLAGDARLLPGLKYLFGFLGTLLSDCGSSKDHSGKFSGTSSSGTGFGKGFVSSKLAGSRRNTETVVLSANQEGGSTNLECDATSVDEDDDDGTSDGEVASIDKDEEEDSNSEKALASKVCTFTSSGSNFMEQHWYFCYTCDLTVSKGCCSICAKVCHRGHRVVYSRSSRFFCDCGAGGVRGSSCQCLKPRKFSGSDSAPSHVASNFQSLLPFTEETDHLRESDSDMDEEVNSDADNLPRVSITRDLQDRIPMLFEEVDVEDQVLQVCSSLLPSITGKRDANLTEDRRIILGVDKVLSYGVELLQLKKAYKGGSLDLKIKADYSNAKELRSHLASGSLFKSLLSVSNRGRLAVGEGDKVAIYDFGQLIGQATFAPVTADKNNVKPVSRNIVRFEIVQLAFNSAVENYLAVAGYEDCQVLTLNPRGEVTDRLAIELALQGAYIRRVDWVPGSQVKLMVVTNRFVKIYDLSQDNISPLHYFTLPDDMIVDATLLVASQGRMFLIVLSEQGCLFRLELTVEGNIGATPLTDVIQIKEREINAKGSSLYFSASLKLLLVSYEDGTTLLGRLSQDATSLMEMSFIYEEQDGKMRSGGLHRWKELLVGSGLFVCFSSAKPNTPVVVSMEPHQLHAQCMRHAGSSMSHVVGLVAYKPLSKDKVHCLVLHDDGSLQIYSHIPADTDTGTSVMAEKVKKLGPGILNNKAYAGVKPVFPLDFFEKTVCITADVKLGGEIVRNGDSEGAKQSLASEEGFLESPSPAGFKISVSNSNPDIVMVGFRVHVGNTSASHIPSELTIFQRVIKLDEGMRSWYDIPFTVAESLLADEEFIISVGPTFNGSMVPRIDSLEIYGRAKDEFGWKEKMDAFLEMESRVLGGSSLLAGSGKKRRSLQSTLVQEQVIADGLKVLSMLYSLCRSPEDMKEELSRNCKVLLETIFESDREQLLQAAACRVLQAAFPNKEMYYKVKDNMRLRGVLKSTSVLLSRLGVGGTTAGWILEEFTAQMCAVSKIAMHRRSNLATFLEINGSEVVDGLMQVLWGILDLEQLDTQTMNNIVISSVELIYCYAECLALLGKDTVGRFVAPAVELFRRLLFFPNEAVQTSSSLAISSRLLQVPFPKQTMLEPDDAVESAVSVSSTEATVTGNAQVMIEEDSITSSVQYCCDGCSTVPILRRRWHCTVCPDFDLCEACYQVLDADRLPPPHSRDHPMTAIPIEVESLVGDGNETRFSGDANDSSLLAANADVSTQNSGSSIHVLEPTELGGFSTSVTDAVSISAPKRAVNSLLLTELLEQLKGWMKVTSGVRAIPLMQLFYRLSSAAGGPFINSSRPEVVNLEKLIRWFLDEIDLDKPFVARTRTSRGEVTILVFMFFTLMLRNWHQPGSDVSITKSSGNADTHDKNTVQVTTIPSPSSLGGRDNDLTLHLLLTSSSLRSQAFVNYLMDILQQLMHVFKSPAANFETSHGLNTGPGCGALLTVRRDLPAGNFSPFFSDSYAKAHRTDIFMDYHRLLLENAFRLVYSLVRPEKHEKTGDREKVYKTSSGKDLKLDGYQDALCSYINNPHTTFVRRYARRLFLHLCGSKTHYYSIRDSWQFSTEVKKLYKHINKSGGLHIPVSYERSMKIVKCLSTMAEVAAARPKNWQKYCLKHGDVLPFLTNGVFYFGEESVIQTLKLLNLAFYAGKEMCHPAQKVDVGESTANKSVEQSADSKKKKKSEDGFDDKSCLDMEAMVDIFNDKGGSCLRQFIDCFLLEWNSSSVRAEAKCVLYGVWHHGTCSFKETMLTMLLQRVKSLPMYGQNITEFTELVSWLLGKIPDNGSKQQVPELVDRCLTPDVIKCLFETLHSQNELVANHPNSRIYNTLSGLVEFDGYYLESEPCVACSSPEVPYSRMKLESLKSETKFTDNRIIVKCTGSYTIQTVTMNVHDARKSKSVKVLNLYYNNRPVADLSELKNNWSLWKRAKSCHLAFNQTELKVEFPIPITACNFMIELDSFYENLQALSLEPLQCPRCSRPVTDKHGICSNCHENAYQCRQCRNINYENLDSFLCNECGYSKYGRFEFNFMAKPSFTFDSMENDEDMKRGLAAIESESENAHRRYQQLLGFKKPLLKLVSSIGENEMDSQQKDSVQQMMVSLPGPSCKINRKIALLGVLYGEKCKAAFDSVSKSVQTLQGLRRVLMSYLHQKHSEDANTASRFVVSRSPNNCYGCATTFVTQCLEILQVLSKHPSAKKQLVAAGILSELFENNLHQGPKTARVQARAVLCAFSEGDIGAVAELNNLIQNKVMYCLEHHRSMDIAIAAREELLLLSEVCTLSDEFWESRLRVVFQLLFSSIKLGAKHPAIAEQIILPCLRVVSQACTPPKSDAVDKEQTVGKSSGIQQRDEKISGTSGSFSGNGGGSKTTPEPAEKTWDTSHKTHDIQLLSYSEWEKGASYLDFVRRQYKVSQVAKGAGQRSRPQRHDYLALKYMLRWKRHTSKAKGDLSVFELGSWVTELILSACSQSLRSEMCMLISILCAQSSARRTRLLNLVMALLPATLTAGDSAAEYFDLLFKMIESEDARLFLTVSGCLTTICKLITQEVGNVEVLERSLHIDISQGFILHKLIELLGKFLEIPNIRSRFMRDNLLSDVLEAVIVIRGLIVQKTKLINDCNHLLNDLLDGLLVESSENKRQFIHACMCGLQNHGVERKARTCLFILEQLCNLICPSKPESVYLLILNKAHTQEEFIRGSMTKNPYSSAEIGPLMRDVKNKICHQLDLLGLLEDDYGMELLVAGNIISLDLSIAQVYEQVWKKSNSHSSNSMTNSSLSSTGAATSSKDSPPMTVTYRLQGLDGEATEPMIKELEEDREESQDPEVEFAIAGAVREYGGLEILLGMIQRLRDDFKSNQEQLVAVLNLLMHCCKIRENRRALLRLGALGLLLETARRAFSVDAMEPAEGILLIVESLTLEANESDNISITQGALTVTNEEAGAGEQAKKIVLMFLERLSHPSGLKKSNKQQRNTEMVARILPYLTYGEPAAMEALIQHFNPYLQDWKDFDRLQKEYEDNPNDENIAQGAAMQRYTVENFVRVSESLKTSSCGERLKDIILEKGITEVAVRHLSESFAVTGQAGFKSTAEWSLGLKLPSLPHILSMLRGLSMGHLPTQKCIDDGGILPLLHALERVAGENEIGARAENLLDTLSNKEGEGDGFLGEKVSKLRHATRDEMRRRALRKREELLKGLGMRQELSSDGGERIVVAQPILEGLDDVEEEEHGLACMVCREGYSLRPTDLLGVYSYSKRVNLGVGSTGSARGDCVYTTVSYFNIIHFQCHQEAKRADAALKNPKKEWEGATLRNNESLCNSLFPIRGPSVPLTQYVRYVDQYWDNLNALGRADGSRLRLLTYDIVLMLARFATGASFSTESRGGGRESNSRFLLFMIQMACHLLEQGSPSQRRSMAKAVSSYIGSSSLDSRPSTNATQPAQGTEETVQFMMVNSLLSESHESWLQHRRAFLQRGIYHAYMQHTHGRSSSRSSTTTGVRVEAGSANRVPKIETNSAEDLFAIIRPMLVYTGLIEQLQHFFKVKKSANLPSVRAEGSSGGSGEDESGNLEGWEVIMKERLLNVREMFGFSKELLCWLDEMNSATDLQEAFDVVGVLADVLSGGIAQCEDFVHAAINLGKS